MGKRKRIDWDAVEPLYRAGVLNNLDIVRQYEADHLHSQVWKATVAESAIRKRAKEKGWEKNLAEKVKKQIKENVVRKEVRMKCEFALTDQEIVDQAASIGSEIVLQHRRDIPKKRALVDKLFAEIETMTDEKETLMEVINLVRDGGEKAQATLMSKLSSLPSRIKGMKELTSSYKELITLERQAFDLNSSSFEGEEVKEITMRVVKP